MDSLLFFFLENMALIIALMYLALKGREAFLSKVKEPLPLFLISSLFIGFLTFSVMHNPYLHEGMRVDLREVPLYFISYIGGWKLGLLSSIFPFAFRFSMGGPTVVLGVIQTIILPVLIGSLFHHKKSANSPFMILNLKRMMIGFFIFEVIKSLWMFFGTPATVSMTLAMIVFAAVAVLAMGLMFNDAHRNYNLRKELEIYSNQDPMTHLPNIRYFKNRMKKIVADKTPFSIVMFDVDNFKQYNDTHGHPKGDGVLRTLGQLMIDSSRKSDVIARYGGEEFILCYTDIASEDDALHIAENFRKKVEANHFDGEESQPQGTLTISVGISYSKGEKTLEQAIEEADIALYKSKKSGKNRVTLYEKSILTAYNQEG
ncbi:MAG TPA: diguanylate cyclase [Planococcus sp. (in: firmicutes)]|nr:diguanylate cyclase [Planococcus sp. (in: firmicutes)]